MMIFLPGKLRLSWKVLPRRRCSRRMPAGPVVTQEAVLVEQEVKKGREGIRS